MGIRFLCPNCDKKLNVKAFLAGKRGICPYCDSGLDIPLESEATNGTAATTKSVEVRTVARESEIAQPGSESNVSSPALADTTAADEISPDSQTTAASSASTERDADRPDPIAEAPDAVWYVRPPSGGQFGPAKGDVMRKWVDEGRVSPEALVWREGWTDWLTAEPVFPSLAAQPAPPPPPAEKKPATPPQPAAQAKPATPARPTAVATPAARTVAADPQMSSPSAAKSTSTSKSYAKRRSNTPALVAVVALVIVSILLLVGLALVLSGAFNSPATPEAGILLPARPVFEGQVT